MATEENSENQNFKRENMKSQKAFDGEDTKCGFWTFRSEKLQL